MGKWDDLFGPPASGDTGNIDVMNRPQVPNPKGGTSTVYSASFNIDGKEVLLPKVSEDGRIMSDDEAVRQYMRTGRHLGKFNSPAEATAFARRLHDQQANLGEARAQSAGDMGPEARRARAGMAPGPREAVPDEDVRLETDQSVTPAGPAGRIRAAGDVQPGSGTFKSPITGAPVTGGMTGDPMAQTIVAGMATGPLGRAATPVLARSLGPAAPAAPVAVGAAEGAAATKMTGGQAGPGAVFGAFGRLGDALHGVGEAVATQQARRAGGTMADLARLGQPSDREALRRLGAEKVDEAGRRFGIVGAHDAATAHANIQRGKAEVGAKIGQMYDTLGEVGARPVGNLMQAARLRSDALRGTRAGNTLADAIDEEMANIFEAHTADAIDKTKATINLGTLNRELQDSAKAGFSGAKFGKLNEKGQAVVAREVAGILRGELDAGLSIAAKNPQLAPVVAARDALNADYSALMAFDKITGRAANKEIAARAPTARERLAEIPVAGRAFGSRQPASTRPIEMPSGKTMAPAPRTTVNVPAASTISPALASALSRGDEDVKRQSLASELFGR